MSLSPVDTLLLAHAGPHLSLTVAGAAVLAGAVLVSRGMRPKTSGSIVFWVAAAGLSFQVVHALEHVLQLAYWLGHPTEAPWLTPWAGYGRDVLATLFGREATVGIELLHLLGNLLFLTGLTALAASARPDRPRSLQRALIVQGLHVGEHVLLTASAIATGRALGATTAFGLLPSGTVLATAVRVWSHFGLNLLATWFALCALHRIMTADDRDTGAGRSALSNHLRRWAGPRRISRTVR